MKSKIILIVALVVFMILAGMPLYQQRNFEEKIITGDSVVDVFKLSKYFEPLEGTVQDTNVYELKGEEPGGKVLIIAGTHENEPSAMTFAFFMVENMKVDKGTIYIIPHFNRSGSLGTQAGGGFPLYYDIDTEWGEKVFRFGDRGLQPLDQWPDPDVYVHYPEGQLLSYIDSRNTNRTWPGKANGTLAEQTTYAAMQMIEDEDIDIVIDLHEAETMYPVTNCIVVPEKSKPYAIGTSLFVKGREGFENHVEPSPTGYRGLSHREIGDYSDAYPFLFESPGAHLDQITAGKTVDLIVSGIDPFIMEAEKKGLLFVPYDENGFSMDRRVGQHSSVFQELMSQWSKKNKDKEVIVEVPKYADIVENGLGYYFKNPDEVDEDLVYIE
ncbi:MAG: hypothetical protein PWQ77_764 [Kosmotogales bacterium]|nr:hypothetical protein [Kosmotogales bacterium]